MSLADQAPELDEAFRSLPPSERLLLLRARVEGDLVFTTSFGLEDQVLLHMIAAAGITVRLATLDTGRLFPETYALWAETEARYGLQVRPFYPDARDLEALVAAQGINGFYGSKAARTACCGVRKLEPLGRALEGAAGWITGLRADQSDGRGRMAFVAADPARAPPQGQPAARLEPRARRRLCRQRGRAGQPAARPGLPLHRLRPVHPRRGPRRAGARRAAGGGSRTARRNAASTSRRTAASSAQGARPCPPLSRLDRLEAESIGIFREVVATCDNPVLLYSIGKDSSVLLHLARKAFYPGPLPFPLLHVDTTWKFREMIEFRDRVAREPGTHLIVHINEEGVRAGINPFSSGSQVHTDVMKTQALKQALDKYAFDAAFGGARRDEEKSRAKERVFSLRSPGHRWDPKNQRPGALGPVQHPQGAGRVVPRVPALQLDRGGCLGLHRARGTRGRPALLRRAPPGGPPRRHVDHARRRPHGAPTRRAARNARSVRFRSLGCYPLSGAVESEAATLDEIIAEMRGSRTSERSTRAIDHDASASMEQKKMEGYF